MQFKFNSKTYSFKPKIIPLVAFMSALMVLVMLSAWQFKRLVWKENLISQRINSFELDPVDFKTINNPEENGLFSPVKEVFKRRIKFARLLPYFLVRAQTHTLVCISSRASPWH